MKKRVNIIKNNNLNYISSVIKKGKMLTYFYFRN